LGRSGLQLDPAAPELLLEIWPHWFELALKHLRQARESHGRLLSAHSDGATEARALALDDEFQSSLQAICAVAFAIDGLYGSMVDHVVVGAETRAQWRRNRTSRGIPAKLRAARQAGLRTVLVPADADTDDPLAVPVQRVEDVLRYLGLLAPAAPPPGLDSDARVMPRCWPSSVSRLRSR